MRRVVSSRAPDCQVQKFVGSSFDEIMEIIEFKDDIKSIGDNLDDLLELNDKFVSGDISYKIILPAIPYGSGMLVPKKDVDEDNGKYSPNQAIYYNHPEGGTVIYALKRHDNVPYDLSQPFNQEDWLQLSVQRKAINYSPVNWLANQKRFNVVDPVSGEAIKFISAEVILNGKELKGEITNDNDPDYVIEGSTIKLTSINVDPTVDVLWFRLYIETPISNPNAVSEKVTSVSFMDFGAIGDGKADDTEAVRRCFEYSASKGVKVVQSTGKFRMAGVGNITISNDADLTGSSFIIDDWAGMFIITNGNGWVEHSVGSTIVNNLNSAVIPAGSSQLPTYDTSGNTELDNSYLIIETAQQMYKYRTKYKTREIFTIGTTKGSMLDPVKYSVNRDITKVSVLKVADKWLTIDGFNAETRNVSSTSPMVIRVVDSTKVNLNTLSFSGTYGEDRYSYFKIQIYKSALVNINGDYSKGIGAYAGQSHYALGMDSSYGIVVDNVIADGNGWGSTGSNACANITFRNCKLNRIDFHEPIQGYLRVIDSDIGNWGILATMMGDLQVRGTNFYQRRGQANDGIIRSRLDTGGFCDGVLELIDCKIIGEDGATSPAIAKCQAQNTGGVPAGSPITDQFFSKITIKNLVRENAGDSAVIVDFDGNRTGVVQCPDIEIDGLYSISEGKQFFSRIVPYKNIDRFEPRRSINNIENPLTGRYTSRVNLHNCNTDTFNMVEKSSKHSPYVTMVTSQSAEKGWGLTTSYDNMGINVEIAQKGYFEFIGCDIQAIDMYSGGYLVDTHFAYIKLIGGRLDTRNQITKMIDWDKHSMLEAVGTQVTVYTDEQLNELVTAMKLSSCSVAKYSNSSMVDPVTTYTYWNGDSTSHMFEATLQIGASYAVTTGYDSDNTSLIYGFTFRGAGTYPLLTNTAQGTIKITQIPDKVNRYSVNIIANSTNKLRKFERVL